MVIIALILITYRIYKILEKVEIPCCRVLRSESHIVNDEIMRSLAQLITVRKNALKVKASIVANALRKPFSTICGMQEKTTLRLVDSQEIYYSYCQ